MKDEVKYYEQMKSSITDKFRLVDHLVGETVLEIGFGGGDLTVEMICNGFDVYGIDSSIISLRNTKSIVPERHKERFFLCDAFNAFKFFKGMKFDNIVLSSVVHEIFSYPRNEYFDNNRVNILKANNWARNKTISLIRELTYLLNTDGKIIIRDGVKVGGFNSTNLCSITINEKEKMMFDEWRSCRYLPKINFSYENNVLKMSKNKMMEFMYTLTWGEDSIAREKLETYGAFTGDELKNIGKDVNLKIVHYEQYIQKGYEEFFEHLNFKDLYAKDNDLPLSNQIIVYQK